jgi:hypothetical protein
VQEVRGEAQHCVVQPDQRLFERVDFGEVVSDVPREALGERAGVAGESCIVCPRRRTEDTCDVLL